MSSINIIFIDKCFKIFPLLFFFPHILQHYMQTKTWVKVAMASKPPEAVDEGRKRGCLFVVVVCIVVADDLDDILVDLGVFRFSSSHILPLFFLLLLGSHNSHDQVSQSRARPWIQWPDNTKQRSLRSRWDDHVHGSSSRRLRRREWNSAIHVFTQR